MSSIFLRNAVSFSIRMWFFLLLLMLPMITLAALTDIYELGLISWFNLFMISIVATLGLTRYLSLSFKDMQEPKFKMKHWQWNFAIETMAWLERHEFVTASLSMLGLFIIFVPFNIIWIWLVSAGIIHSATTSMIFLVVLVLPFFIVPSSILFGVYESTVHPEEASLSQITEIVEKIFAVHQLTGEALERVKRTWVTTLDGRTRKIAILMLISLAVLLGALQFVELGLLPQKVLDFIFFYMIAQVILMFLLLFSGNKKSELDLLIESEEGKSNEDIKQFRFLVGKMSSDCEKLLDEIKSSWWYKLIIVLGGLLSFLATILRLLGFI